MAPDTWVPASRGGLIRLTYADPVSTATASQPALPTQPVPVPVVARASGWTVARAYLSLTKPRIVELLLVTTVPAMVLAAGGVPDLGLAAVVLVAGALAAGAANTINCYIDRDIDQVMSRTARRPLPAHRVRPGNVLGFGLLLAVLSIGLMATFTNLLAAALTLGAILYYDLVYTWWLKRRTPHNTVLGGVCGAAPVLIGWAAVTGTLGVEAWLMFAVVFLWQPPHFYALALRFRDDYARAGVPMLPVVAGTGRVTGESVAYCWATVAASLALWPVAGLSPLYAAVAVAMGALLLVQAHRLHQRARAAAALAPMRLFHTSTSYLAVVFIAIAVDVLVVG